MIYVLYHGNCYDGFGSAFSAWKKFGDTAKYKAVSYGQPFPRDFLDELNSVVFILDFSYPKDEMLYWADFYKFIVLDHHKTAQANFEGLFHPNIEANFDMTKSGARLSWEYFHGKPSIEQLEKEIGQWIILPDGSAVPKLIAHIEDRDLWKFELDRSKEIHKSLVSYPMDFKLWDTFDVEKLKIEGVALERLYTQLVDNICGASWKGNLGKHIDVPMVNTSIAWSEVGHALLQKYQDAKFVASFTEFEKETMWSLRSREDFDCSEIAKEFGGGGHKQASGFKVKR